MNTSKIYRMVDFSLLVGITGALLSCAGLFTAGALLVSLTLACLMFAWILGFLENDGAGVRTVFVVLIMLASLAMGTQFFIGDIPHRVTQGCGAVFVVLGLVALKVRWRHAAE